MVVCVVLLAAVCAGACVWLLARRWPSFDPAAPRIDAPGKVDRETLREHPRLRMLLRRHVDPRVATGLILTVALTTVGAATVAIGALLAMVDTHRGLARWDLAFARWGADHATSTSTSLMRDISLLGGTAGVFAVAIVVGVVEYRRRPNRAIPALLALVLLGQFAVLNLVKVLVNRPRPDLSRLTGFSGASFPSGHATAAAATYALVALLLGRGRSRWMRNLLAAGAVAISVLVAGSRVMLGVHWFTDVLAGLALGWGWLALCSVAFGGRILSFGEPVATAERVADAAAAPAVPALKSPTRVDPRT
jgi:undecaprenyl-diphosphatase